MSVFTACGLTVIIETPFVLLTLKRSRDFAIVAVCANVLTNLTLNLVYSLLYIYVLRPPWTGIIIYPLEACVVAAEFLIYRAYLKDVPKLKIFLLTLAANAVSYGVGVMVFGHV